MCRHRQPHWCVARSASGQTRYWQSPVQPRARFSSSFVIITVSPPGSTLATFRSNVLLSLGSQMSSVARDSKTLFKELPKQFHLACDLRKANCIFIFRLLTGSNSAACLNNISQLRQHHVRPDQNMGYYTCECRRKEATSPVLV